MMKFLKAKNKKGFTLMEMLIVIAIIAILVAIAIPTFSGAMKKARYATDLANARGWYAEKLLANVVDQDPLPTSYDGPELQLKDDGAKVTVVGTTADTFTVTYDANGGDADDDDDGYDSVIFPTPAS